MRYVIILLSVLLISCATVPICPPDKPCPQQDSVILVGPGIPVFIPKGAFDDPAYWKTPSDFEEWVKEQNKPSKPKEREI